MKTKKEKNQKSVKAVIKERYDTSDFAQLLLLVTQLCRERRVWPFSMATTCAFPQQPRGGLLRAPEQQSNDNATGQS